MGNDRVLQALSLCRKAGALQIGFDASVRELQKHARCAAVSSDISDRTLRGILKVCDESRVIHVGRTQQQIEAATGRKFAVAVITDDRLAALLRGCVDKDKEAVLNGSQV